MAGGLLFDEAMNQTSPTPSPVEQPLPQGPREPVEPGRPVIPIDDPPQRPMERPTPSPEAPPSQPQPPMQDPPMEPIRG